MWKTDSWHNVAFADAICECGNSITTRLADLKNGTTRTCGCGNFVSGLEVEFTDFLSSLADTSTQVRFGRWTYDAAISGLNLLFDFNGCYWHSYPRTRRAVHEQRRLLSEKNGYRLISIWEDDWLYKRGKIEAFLRRVISGSADVIGARKLSVVEIEHAPARGFHEKYHLQGFNNTNAPVHIALVGDGEPLAVASFSADSVLHRYTVAEGVTIPGGLSRLVSEFKKRNDGGLISTFCDRDYFTGEVYRASGFIQEGTSLTMSYVVRRERHRRERYQKHKLPSLFGDVDMTKREIDICAENRVYACWNSGTDKYILP
jgi:hypothetical protein